MTSAQMLACAMIIAIASAPVSAQDKRAAPSSPPAKNPPASMTAISPIFGQIFAFSMPSTFKLAHEKSNAASYIREAVLAGETVEKWTQMITVSGYKGVAGNPNITPRRFVESIASGFNKACPTSFAGQVIGDAKFSGHDAIMAVASCGTVKMGGNTHSETALLIVIKGEADYYTLQWAERAPATAAAPQVDLEKWKSRVAALQPVRLCPIVPGEKAPFPSCINRK